MAQVTGQTSGLQIDVIHDKADDAEDFSEIGQKFWDALKCYERGQFKAAAAHGVDAINLIAAQHSISCGASL